MVHSSICRGGGTFHPSSHGASPTREWQLTTPLLPSPTKLDEMTGIDHFLPLGAFQGLPECSRSSDKMAMNWFSNSIAAMVAILPLAANAPTPLPWVVDFSQCTGVEVTRQLSRTNKPLSNSEAGRTADEIFDACSWTMPAEMTPDQRKSWLKSFRKDQMKRLRYHSRHKEDR